ncbi:MAG: response regulator [Alphaproteobacteria bacterium]|nr:response regulator [Alphaproteobacteria bacterium]
MALDLNRLNVLVAEDNAYMRVMIREILINFGVSSIQECKDGADALSVLRNWTADIIFMDWMMEPMDGLEFTRAIRTDPTGINPYVPIIMLTGHTEHHRIIEARDAGVTEFLAKPVTANGVYSRIKSVVENPRPFIKTARYLGPSRRRRQEEMVAHNRRHSTSEDVDIAVPSSF